MDRESKGKKFRTSSSKEHRAKSRGKPRFQSASSQPKYIHQMIKQNDQKITDLTNRRDFLMEELKKIKHMQSESQFKEKIISSFETQIKMIEEGLNAAIINSQKLTIMWIAELNISNLVPEFQQQIKKKTEKKKYNIGSKMKKFTSENQEQE